MFEFYEQTFNCFSLNDGMMTCFLFLFSFYFIMLNSLERFENKHMLSPLYFTFKVVYLCF